MTNQVSPLGAPDFSSYLLNIANSGADVFVNVNWGHDAVLSIQQAKQFGVLDKMKLVVPYQMPFLAREVGGELMARRLCRHRFLVDAARTSIRWPRCSSTEFEKKYGYKPEWGANALHAVRAAGPTPSRRPAPSIRRTSSRPTRAAQKLQSTVGEVYFRAAKITSSSARSSSSRGKKPSDMKDKEDYWEVVEVVPGEPLMQKPDAFGCKLGDYT